LLYVHNKTLDIQKSHRSLHLRITDLIVNIENVTIRDTHKYQACNSAGFCPV